MIQKWTIRFKNALAGIKHALRHDASYRQQFYGIGLILALFLYFTRPISDTEILFVALAYTLILITELQNSSLEEALDHMHPEKHDMIGRSKDMAAGAVLTAGFFLLFVLSVITFF